jgi:hypothetical protein
MLLGFHAGNVMADTAARIRFEKADLYTASSRLHQETKTDFLFANRPSQPKTFEVEQGPVEKSIEGVARAFGKKATKVASVVVLDDGLADRATAAERMDEANMWLLARLPASDARRAKGESDAFWIFLDASRLSAQSLSAELGAGTTTTFGELTPQQQQTALDLARAAKWSLPANHMASLLDQWGQYRHPRR